MAMIEELEQSGAWLFKWRSYIPLLLVAVFVATMFEYSYPGGNEQWGEYWVIICFGVSLFGQMIRWWTLAFTPDGTSGRNTTQQVAHELNTTGIYSIVRNPLYLGNYFMVLGVAMFPFNGWLVAVYTLIFWLYHERIVFTEEAFLRTKFGQPYLDWTEKTRAFVPSLGNYTKPSTPFSFKKMIFRENNSFMEMILIFYLFEVLRDYVLTGKFDKESGWLIVLGVSTVIWVVVRVIRKSALKKK